jgi:hypothetical protein
MGKNIPVALNGRKYKDGFFIVNQLNFYEMKKKIEVKLELNKKTIAKLDPASMKKIKGGTNGDNAASQTDAKSDGADCSCACCASTES